MWTKNESGKKIEVAQNRNLDARLQSDNNFWKPLVDQ